jgi:hypothetical protein
MEWKYDFTVKPSISQGGVGCLPTRKYIEKTKKEAEKHTAPSEPSRASQRDGKDDGSTALFRSPTAQPGETTWKGTENPLDKDRPIIQIVDIL